jgi:hypothetical protein
MKHDARLTAAGYPRRANPRWRFRRRRDLQDTIRLELDVPAALIYWLRVLDIFGQGVEGHARHLLSSAVMDRQKRMHRDHRRTWNRCLEGVGPFLEEPVNCGPGAAEAAAFSETVAEIHGGDREAEVVAAAFANPAPTWCLKRDVTRELFVAPATFPKGTAVTVVENADGEDRWAIPVGMYAPLEHRYVFLDADDVEEGPGWTALWGDRVAVHHEPRSSAERRAMCKLIDCDCDQSMECPQGKVGAQPRCKVWVRALAERDDGTSAPTDGPRLAIRLWGEINTARGIGEPTEALEAQLAEHGFCVSADGCTLEIIPEATIGAGR